MNSLRLSVGAVCAWLLAAACSDATSPQPAGDHAGHADHAAHALAAAASPSFNVAATTSTRAPVGAPVTLVSGLGATLCASVSGASRSAGAELVTATCTGGAHQQFTFTAAGTVTVYGGALCVDVSGSGVNGNRILTAACRAGAADQQWQHLANGTVKGMNGRCLNVRLAATTPGARLILWTCNTDPNEQWIARAVTASPTPPPVTSPTPPPTTPTTPPTVPPPTGTGSWTHCTGAGALCTFVGLREVRFGGPNGPYVTQIAYGSVPCAMYGFNNQNPAPGQALHCDYGPLLTATIANPMPGMGPLAAATVTVPRGGPGAAGPQARTGGGAGVPIGSGAFRTTCGLATHAFDDPIVYPGRAGAAHLHAFFGNTAVDASSTPERLVAGGNSTCLGGTLNRSSYWVPALVDAGTGLVQAPDLATIYYKTGYNVTPSSVQTFPAGLRMIAGDMRATGAQQYITWSCRDRYVVSATVPTTCPVGDAVRLTIQFPQCWDGVRLDAPDHKSHMAYPVYRNPPQASTCPPSHPVMLPEITEHFDYPVVAGASPARWRLSSDMYDASRAGGLSAHADWMNGWDAATMRTIVTQCLNRGADCGVGLLGDGRSLY